MDENGRNPAIYSYPVLPGSRTPQGHLAPADEKARE